MQKQNFKVLTADIFECPGFVDRDAAVCFKVYRKMPQLPHLLKNSLKMRGYDETSRPQPRVCYKVLSAGIIRLTGKGIDGRCANSHRVACIRLRSTSKRQSIAADFLTDASEI